MGRGEESVQEVELISRIDATFARLARNALLSYPDPGTSGPADSVADPKHGDRGGGEAHREGLWPGEHDQGRQAG